MSPALDVAARAAGGRIRAALAARYRDLDLAEEAFAEACVRAAARWPIDGEPRDPAAWLYRASERIALDSLRQRKVRREAPSDAPPAQQTAEDAMVSDERLIPDERLRLIFVCCHPAIAAEARAALTLRLVCGLETGEIARAFLVAETTLAQRLVRAKRKIADAGVPFEIPGPDAWPDRLDAVLSTLEIAYAKAHEDAAGAGQHAGYAAEMLTLSATLSELLPREPEALAFAALVRFAEARRPTRLAEDGAMVPLSDQDPALWRRPLIDQGEGYLTRAIAAGGGGPRVLQAAIHGAWCARSSLNDPPPWPDVLHLYDALLTRRDDVVVRLNRAVALAEVASPAAALAEVEALPSEPLKSFAPYHAVRADLLRRTGQITAAASALQEALALSPAPAERIWLERRLFELKA